MGKLYVIQTGTTTWEEESRVESMAGAPLSDTGRAQAQTVAGELAGKGLRAIYASSGEAEQQTAAVVAGVIGAKIKTINELHEIDYGLWQGLTLEEIRRRQPKVFRQWTEDPSSVRPPGGETLQEARARLREAVKDILRRSKDEPVLVVLRPIALALLKGIVNPTDPADAWPPVAQPTRAWVFEVDDKTL